MVALNLPFYPFKLKEIDHKVYIFDEIRKKYLFLTPEEWVRQHVIQYLINHKSYPKTLIKIESSLYVNSLKRRSDILTLDHEGLPYLLVECKAPNSKINEITLEQAALYNYGYKAKIIVLTNGMQLYVCIKDNDGLSFSISNEIPPYSTTL